MKNLKEWRLQAKSKSETQTAKQDKKIVEVPIIKEASQPNQKITLKQLRQRVMQAQLRTPATTN